MKNSFTCTIEKIAGSKFRKFRLTVAVETDIGLFIVEIFEVKTRQRKEYTKRHLREFYTNIRFVEIDEELEG